MKNTFIRLLALVLIFVMALPLLAACGDKKPAVTTGNNTTAGVTTGKTPEGTTEGSTTGDDPNPNPNPEDPTITAKKQAIAAILEALASNGSSADSQITAQLKAEIVAKLWGETAEFPLDVPLGTIAGAMTNTKLTKDLYNTLLLELAKIGAANDAEITIGTDGNATYTVPASQLEAVISWWLTEENVAAFVESLANKAASDPEYVITDKAILDFIVWATLYSDFYGPKGESALPGNVQIPQEMLDAVLVYVEGDDLSQARPCTEAEDGDVIEEFLAKQTAFEAYVATVTPTTDADEVIATIVEYADYILALEEDGYYSKFYIDCHYIGSGSVDGDVITSIAVPTMRATNAISYHRQEMLAVLRDYTTSKDLDAMIEDFLFMAVEGMFYVPTPDLDEFDNEEEYRAYIEEHKHCTADAAVPMYELLIALYGNADYETLLGALEAVITYEVDCNLYFADMPLEAFQSTAMMFQMLLVTLDPSEEASVEDAGIHHVFAQMLCNYTGFAPMDENEVFTDEYVEFATLTYDLIRAAVYGTAFDLPAHADALLTMFDVPLTFEEIQSNSPLYLIAKLNDTYDFTSILLNPNLIPPAETEEYVGFINILDEYLLSLLTLNAEGKIDASVFTKDHWEAMTLALYDYMLETSDMLPADAATALETLITDLFDGKADAFTTLAEALVHYAPLSKPEETVKEGVIGKDYGVLEYDVSFGILIETGGDNFNINGSAYVDRELDPNLFAQIEEFINEHGSYDNLTSHEGKMSTIAGLFNILYNHGTLNADDAHFFTEAELANATEFKLEYSIRNRSYGEYEIYGEIPTIIYVPVADADLTEEELALITTFRTELVDLVAAYETLFHATEETAETAALAAIQAYVDLLSAMADISAVDCGIGAMGGIPAEMLEMMIVIYSYPLAETPTEGNYALLEGLTGMSSEEIAQMMAGMIFGLFTDETLSDEAFNDSIELCERLLDCILNTESTDDMILVLADLVSLLGENYTGVNADMWAQMFGPEAETPDDETVKTVSTVLMIALLTLTDNVEDYNAYFEDMQLPAAVQSIDFNLFFAKLKSEATYENLLSIVDVDVVQIFAEGTTTVIGETITISLGVDFDILLASLDGSVTLTFDIVY